MAHPTFFRTSLVSGYVADRPAAPAIEWKPLEAASRLFRGLDLRVGSAYRPERHYMRGGRTPGAKSLLAGR
jgi:hypothetical protein